MTQTFPNSNSNYAKIVAFHEALEGDQPTTPVAPSAETLALRQKLIREEYEEVCEAFAAVTAVLDAGDAPDLSQLAHELADLLYVVYGTFAACGIDADAVFSEVHRANMTKIGGPRRADGKLLKPPGWQPADVRGVLRRLGSSER